MRSVVFFHEVTIPPGTVEGTHQHIGSEELYYIIEGKGVAYMREGDDPTADATYPTVTREIYGLGPTRLQRAAGRARAASSSPRAAACTGSATTVADPLRFVAFLYHTV